MQNSQLNNLLQYFLAGLIFLHLSPRILSDGNNFLYLIKQSCILYSTLVRPFRVERKIAVYKTGATNRITLGAYIAVVSYPTTLPVWDLDVQPTA